MCCVLVLLAVIGPRIAGFFWWLIDSTRFSTLFDTWVLPFIGILFLPWTTLAYVLFGFEGITGLEIFLVILAFLVDVSSSAGGALSGKGKFK